MKRTRYTVALLSGVSALSMAAASWAADAPAVEEIVVTGSRIVIDGTKSPTPLTVVGIEQLQDSAPASIADALNKLPQFTGSQSQYQQQITNIGNSGPQQGNYLNLRRLGIFRHLVLLDGQRVPPTNYTGAVDLNILPSALVSRVEVVTGGASAAYGSDAVSGVVNYVLDKNYEGVKGSVQTGLSEYADKFSSKATLAAGHSFMDGRIRILVSGEHSVDRGLYDGLKMRPLGDDARRYAQAGAGTQASPFFTQAGLVRTTSYPGGMIRSGTLNGYVFNTDGTVRPRDVGIITGGPSFSIGTNDGITFNSAELRSLITPLKTNAVFARFAAELTEDTTFYVQTSYGDSFTRGKVQVAGFNSPGPAQVRIFADNAYLNPAARTQIFGANPAAGANFIFTSSFPDKGYLAEINTDALSTWVGLDGKLGTWNYNVNYTHADSGFRSMSDDMNIRNLGAASDAVRNPTTGQVVCAVSLTQYANLYPGCVPFNMFGQDKARPGAPTEQLWDFLLKSPRFFQDARNKMDLVAVSVNGDLFDGWAGPIKAAAGAEYRKQSMLVDTNADQASIDFTGLRAVNTTDNQTVFGQDGAAKATGSYNVKEAFIETAIPIAADKPFFQALEFNGAFRYTDYSTSGGVTTWKLGLSNQFNPEFRARGTVSRDIRAPSVYELFRAPAASIGGFTDPLTRVTQSLVTRNQGNADLQPEKGVTWTTGVVYQPAWWDGISLSVDYYHITIKDVISSTNSIDQINECIRSSNFSAPICNSTVRPFPWTNTTAANFPSLSIISVRNLSSLVTEGLDLEASYRLPVEFLGGDWSARVLAGYLMHYTTRNTANDAEIERVGYNTGGARFKGSLTLNYKREGFSASVTNRMTGAQDQGPTNFYGPADVHLPNRVYTDLAMSYEFVTESVTLTPFLNVANLTSVDPPLRAQATGPGFAYPTDRELYDIVGTYFTAGVRFKF